MKSANQIKKYLESHYFETRRNAYSVRFILLHHFPGETFELKWNMKNTKGVTLTTFNETLEFIFKENE
jgi:hypothetical protein